MIDQFWEGPFGKIHYAYTEQPGKPYVLFHHGADTKLQNIEYWLPLVDIMTSYCNPVLIERIGHGQSTGDSSKIPPAGLTLHLCETLPLDGRIGMVGRSAGGWYAVKAAVAVKQQYPELRIALGLIAPAGIPRYNDDLQQLKDVPTVAMWHERDTVVSFDGFKVLKEAIPSTQLYLVGASADAVVQVPFAEEAIPSPHVPERNYPDLFEQFLRGLAGNIA